MRDCCEHHAEGGPGWFYLSTRTDALSARARFIKRGDTNAGDAHLIARLHLGLLDDPPVHCAHCGEPDCRVNLQAALNWPAVPADRLRQDARGRIFSISPETDYLALCIPCHRRLDSWRQALHLRGVIAQNPEEQ